MFERQQKSSRLQILAKRIIVDTTGEMIDNELNSSFDKFLRSLTNDKHPLIKEGCGSEQIPPGALKLDKTSQKSFNIEEFLAGLRFEQRGKQDGPPISWQDTRESAIVWR